MSPERKTVINRRTIEEFYWAGRTVVYIDNLKTDETYEAACKRLKEETGLNDLMPPEALSTPTSQP